MKMQIYSLLFAVCLITSYNTIAQTTPVKWGKVTREDLDLKSYNTDTSANAFIIAEVGNTSFVGNTKGGFSLKFLLKKRVAILKKAAFDEATVQVPLFFQPGAEEKLMDLKATAYNLENGEVVATKMEKESVFEDKVNKNYKIRKFAVPGVKEGSIIEYSYEVHSDFISTLQPWYFQNQYPTLWSEYSVTIPNSYNYVRLTKGTAKYFISEEKSTPLYINMSYSDGNMRTERASGTVEAKQYRWVMKDVPAIRNEPFISTLVNHRMGIEFQLSSTLDPYRDIMGSWPQLAFRLMQDEEFGLTLKRNNGFFEDDLNKLVKGVADKTVKARKIYEYVRDNFTCTSPYGISLQRPLKDVYRTKSGTAGELNLLLISMLLHEKINAYPVLFSTRDNGETVEMYPLLSRFNYCAVAMEDDKGENFMFMDAAKPSLGFNKFSADLYNGHARIITEQTIPIYLDADSLVEADQVAVFINPEGKKLKGSYSKNVGYFGSTELRDLIRTKGKEAYIADLQKRNADMEINEVVIDSLKNYDEALRIGFNFTMKDTEDEDIIYLDPFVGDNIKDNPFKAADRLYPIEMPYRKNDMYVFNLTVPEGYMIDELPKSSRIMFNENEGMYEYLIGKSGNMVQLRTRFIMGKATFQPDEYQTLREFYAHIVKKQSEQIVLKKIK